MPNTNPSDLDRAARNLDDKIMDFLARMEYDLDVVLFDDIVLPALNQLRAALALPRASGVPEAEAVAWRWRQQSWDVGIWALSLNPKTAPAKEFIVEPLYASSPPVAAPSGEAEAVALTYRNYRGEVAVRNVKPISVRYGSTEWHPRPQWLLLAFDCDKQAEREFALEDIGASYPPIASEPKDAGSGEGQELTQQEQYNALHAAWSNGLLPISSTLYALNAAGYRITRTAPSGAKPGDVE